MLRSFESRLRGSGGKAGVHSFSLKTRSPVRTSPRGSAGPPRPPWGARLCQGSAREVVGLHGFETRLRGSDRETEIRVQRRGVEGRKPPPIGMF